MFEYGVIERSQDDGNHSMLMITANRRESSFVGVLTWDKSVYDYLRY